MNKPVAHASSIVSLSLQVGLIIALIAIIVPLSPKMPSTSLDGGWAYALSEAVARGLVFGRDILFTLGPYAAVYTKVYHPATDMLTLYASLFLALNAGIGLCLLLRGRGWQSLALWAILLPGIACSRDALLLAIPLIAGLTLLKTEKPATAAFLLAPIGLLVLVKGTFLLYGVCVLLFSGVLLAKRRQLWVLAAPALTMGAFWMLAGQPLGALVDYLQTSVHMALAFSEPMALDGPPSDILLYLMASAGIFWVIQREASAPRGGVAALVSLYLFVCFKAAFTRHGGHAFIAALAPLLVTLLLPAFVRLRDTWPALLPAIITFVTITTTTTTPDPVRNAHITWSTFHHGLTMRFTHPERLRENHALTMTFWKNRTPLPALTGRTDIYSYDQTALLAANPEWSPRPVFQSYSVFDRAFAEKNRAHLQSTRAPDNILFRIAPIDGRLPALEDGASWPVLLSDYQPRGFVQGFLWLQKNREVSRGSPLSSPDCQPQPLGTDIPTPHATRLFATLHIRPSWTGRLITTFYHASALHLYLTLADGSTRRYRINAGMTAAGFLLSPLVESTEDFAVLSEKSPTLRAKEVMAFRMEAENAWQWQEEVAVCLQPV